MKNKIKFNIIITTTIILTCLGLLSLFSHTKKCNKREYYSNVNNEYLNFIQKLNDNDSLISKNSYYNSNNYDVLYHEELEFKDLPKELVLDINDPVIYYKPNTFLYGSQYYVPTYEDTVYLNYVNNYIDKYKKN
jgi:hypothetical protein